MNRPGAEAARATGLHLILAAIAVALGVFLRIDQIDIQIPGDDEWHALHAARDHGFTWILTHLGSNDHSIPLALYDRFLLLFVGVCEWSFRLPVVLVGCATLVILPLAARRLVGSRVACLLAVLLSLSPFHVGFSRTVRPYAFVALLAPLAVLSFRRALNEGGRWMALTLACIVTAPWFHLTSLPIVLSPFLLAGLDLVRGRLDAPARRRLLSLGLTTTIGLLVLLGPPLVGDGASLTEKTGGERPGFDTVTGAALLFSGDRGGFLLPLLLAFAILGVAILLDSRRELAGAILVAGAAHIATLFLTGASLLDQPVVLARYSIGLLPLLLLVAASGLGAEGRLLPPRLGALAGAAFAALLLFQGPLLLIHGRPNSFLQHPAYQYDYAQWEERKARLFDPRYRDQIPSFYYELGNTPPAPGEGLLEAPFSHFAQDHVHYAYYQRIHHRRVFVARPAQLGEERLVFDGLVDPLDEESVHDRGIRWVVFHRAPERELRNSHPGTQHDVSDWIATYRSRYGAPVVEDRLVTVFDLASEESASRQRDPDVVLITIDTLRADHLGCYGYPRTTSPRLDALAREGILFENVVASCSFTGPSVASILTGKYPRFNSYGYSNLRSRLVPEETTVAELFQAAGYATAAFVCNPILSRKTGMGQGFELYDDHLDETEAVREEAPERTAPRLLPRVVSWIEERRNDPRPVFLWVHLQDPHGPYLPPAPFDGLFRSSDPGPEIAAAAEDDQSGRGAVPAYQAVSRPHHLNEYVDRYDAEIACADHHLGLILDSIAQVRSTHERVVLVTADHGEALGENGYWFAHGHDVTPDQTRVPLILVHPSLEAARVKTRVGHVDVFPTLAGIIAREGPDPGYGDARDLVAVARSEAVQGPDELRPLVADAGDHIAVYRDDHLLRGQLASRDAGQLASARGVDLTGCTLLLGSSLAAPADPADPLLMALSRELGSYLDHEPARFASLDPPRRRTELLRALGYVED
jgi:arylsulfatase